MKVTNSSFFRRLWCALIHGKGARKFERGAMGWQDWEKCQRCGAIHKVG